MRGFKLTKNGKRIGRPPKLAEQDTPKFLAEKKVLVTLMRKYGLIGTACEELGWTLPRYREARLADPDFAQAMDDAHVLWVDEFQNAFHQRAKSGEMDRMADFLASKFVIAGYKPELRESVKVTLSRDKGVRDSIADLLKKAKGVK